MDPQTRNNIHIILIQPLPTWTLVRSTLIDWPYGVPEGVSAFGQSAEVIQGFRLRHQPEGVIENQGNKVYFKRIEESDFRIREKINELKQEISICRSQQSSNLDQCLKQTRTRLAELICKFINVNSLTFPMALDMDGETLLCQKITQLQDCCQQEQQKAEQLQQQVLQQQQQILQQHSIYHSLQLQLQLQVQHQQQQILYLEQFVRTENAEIQGETAGR